MLKLMRLELKRNNMRSYLMASAVSCVVLLGFIYFIAYAAQLGDTEEFRNPGIAFRNYTNIFRLVGIISLVIFGTISAVMYSRFIISEYTGKRAALVFSYPVSRSKVLLAKLLLVFAFTSISMIICTSIPYVVFYMTESVSPIVVQDILTIRLVTDALKMLGVSILALGGIGIVSMRIGFIKKSVPTTMISAFLLSAFYGNILSALYGSTATSATGVLSSLIIGGIGLIATIFVMFELSNKVNKMEVE